MQLVHRRCLMLRASLPANYTQWLHQRCAYTSSRLLMLRLLQRLPRRHSLLARALASSRTSKTRRGCCPSNLSKALVALA